MLTLPPHVRWDGRAKVWRDQPDFPCHANHIVPLGSGTIAISFVLRHPQHDLANAGSGLPCPCIYMPTNSEDREGSIILGPEDGYPCRVETERPRRKVLPYTVLPDERFHRPGWGHLNAVEASVDGLYLRRGQERLYPSALGKLRKRAGVAAPGEVGHQQECSCKSSHIPAA